MITHLIEYVAQTAMKPSEGSIYGMSIYVLDQVCSVDVASSISYLVRNKTMHGFIIALHRSLFYTP